MANEHNEEAKKNVQTTKLNKLPVPDPDTEFSAEDAAEVFQENQASERAYSERAFENKE